MKSAIPVWCVVIDKSTPSYPLYVKNVLVDHRILWDYYENDDRGFEETVKDVLGINSESPVVFYTFCDYLIHPQTGEKLRGESKETLGQFMKNALVRHVELVSSAPNFVISGALC